MTYTCRYPQKPEEDAGDCELGFISGYELPNMGVGKLTQVL